MPHRQSRVAETLRLPKSDALRVSYWLQRLHQRCLAHDNVHILRFQQAQARSLIATVDFETKEVGCAWCGEFAAFFRADLDPTFKTVQVPLNQLPYDVRRLNLCPVLLYCAPCFETNSWVLPELGYNSSSQSI